MENTAESIKAEMKKRGILPSSQNDIILCGIMLSLEKLTEKTKE